MDRGLRRTACCVLLADVDGLKAINDRGGHKAGDVALLAVVRGLTGNVRIGDTVARMGGDEFAVLVPNASMRDATRLADRILSEVALSVGAFGGHLTISIGIAERRSRMVAEDLVAAADRALYQAKRAGGGRIVVARP
jgi:diguanylate cyclase (GGDEF)-like protein